MNLFGSPIIAARVVCFAALAATLTACPPPPQSVTLYQANLASVNGTTTYGTVTATLNTTVISFAGDIYEAGSGDEFAVSVKCSQTQDLQIGTANGHPTIFGNFANGTDADRTTLNAGQCLITVFKITRPNGTEVRTPALTGYLKVRG